MFVGPLKSEPAEAVTRSSNGLVIDSGSSNASDVLAHELERIAATLPITVDRFAFREFEDAQRASCEAIQEILDEYWPLARTKPSSPSNQLSSLFEDAVLRV